jgi:hypothetical protein
MRILIVSSFFPPLNSIASHRPYSWAKYWSRAGHEVSVLTPTRNIDSRQALHCNLDGFQILTTLPKPWLDRLRKQYNEVRQPNASHGLRQMLNQAFHSFRQRTGIFAGSHFPDFSDMWVPQAMKCIRQHPTWDVVVSTAPPFSVHRLGYKIKKEGLAKRWIADFRDLIVDSR